MSAARKSDARRRRGLAFWIFALVAAVVLLLTMSRCLRGGDAGSTGTVRTPEVKPEPPLPPAPEPKPTPAVQPTPAPEPAPTPMTVSEPKPEPPPAPAPEPVPEPTLTPAAESTPITAPPPAPAPPSAPTVQVGPSRGPSLAEGNEPARYPLSARRRGQEGTAVVHASIDTEGKVTGARVARSSGVDSIDEAAVAAVRSWRFVPALDQGAPVASEADLPVVFRLRPPSTAGR